MFQTITKRDGREVPYDIEKIAVAINKAMEASGRRTAGEESRRGWPSLLRSGWLPSSGTGPRALRTFRTSSRLC